MNHFAALLRGINVGKIRIKMNDLKDCFEKTGCMAVQTFLQSGNVVFKCAQDSAAMKVLLQKALSERFNYEAFVQILSMDDLQNALDGFPFSTSEDLHNYILFIETPESLEDLKTTTKDLDEPLIFTNQWAYWQCPKGQTLDTPFSKLISKPKFKAFVTMRNTQTIEKMLFG